MEVNSTLKMDIGLGTIGCCHNFGDHTKLGHPGPQFCYDFGELYMKTETPM